MARILNPLGGVSVVGSVAGLVYSVHRGVNTVQAKSSPGRRLRPLTGYMSDNRSRFGWLSAAWGLLSAGDRAQWDAYAKNHPQVNNQGTSFLLDGYQTHLKMNHTACRLGGVGNYFNVPPLIDLVPRVDSLVCVPGALTKQIACTITLAGTGIIGDFIEYNVAGPFESPGRRAVQSRFAFAGTTTGVILVLSLTTIAADKYFWVRARYTGTRGQTSNWTYYQSKSKV